MNKLSITTYHMYKLYNYIIVLHTIKKINITYILNYLLSNLKTQFNNLL